MSALVEGLLPDPPNGSYKVVIRKSPQAAPFQRQPCCLRFLVKSSFKLVVRRRELCEGPELVEKAEWQGASDRYRMLSS
jgi:hypothetical protein